MRVDEGLRQHWAEPHEAELFQPLPSDPEQAAAQEQGSTAPPPEPPPTAFWEPAPVQANALNDLPPAPQAQAAEGAAATSARATAAANATTAAAAMFAGEPPADPQWLLDREKALVAIRADYTAARTQAESTAGVGPGWIVASTVTDESGATRSVSGRALVFVADPTAPPVIAGYDERGGPLYQPGGRWMEFDEEAFAAHYRAQLDGPGGAHLQSLAALYDTDVAGLFAQHPEIWGLATSDHAINAGPPPAGRAMGDPGQLAMLDLYMRDPQVAALIDAYGGQPSPATSEMAREQVRIHGQQRYEQLSRLDNAMASVRQQYADALVQAQASGVGPGWVERARTVTVSDESGRTTTQALYVTDDSGQPLRDANGQPQAQMERLFDPDVFTAWYVQQGGLQHQAFKDIYGQSHTTFATDESGRTVAAATSFDNPNWAMGGIGWMVHKELACIDPSDPPRLHDSNAVGFDLEAGWATPHSNIKPERDWFETAIKVAMVAVVSYISAGQLGPQAATAMGLTTTAANGTVALSTAGIMVSGAIAGGATSLVSGMMNGNVTFKSVLQGALAGGLSAGLIRELGPIAAQAGPVGTLALRTTVQGGIQALLGGEFKDGALAGFASGLADLVGANMKASIDKAVDQETMTAAEAAVARTFARVVGSAIRAAGSPDDPAHAFASAFLDDLLAQTAKPSTPPATGLAFDDDGNLNAGIVDPNAPPEQQRAQLQAHLERQGLGAEHARALVAQYFDQNVAVSYPVLPGGGTPLPLAQRSWEMTRQDASGRIVEHVVSEGDDKAFHYRSEVEGQYTLTTGPNHALVRGADGQLQLVSSAVASTGTWEVVVAPGQTVVTNGVQALAVTQGADPNIVALASTLVAPVALAPNALSAEALLSALARGAIRWATPTALRAAGALGLVFSAVGLGGGEKVVDINDNARLVKPSGDVAAGQLEIRTDTGEWIRLEGREFVEYQVRDLLATQRTSMLSPEDLRRLTGPMINLPVSPGPAGTPGYVADDRDTSTPGYQSPDSQSTSTTTLPATPAQDWRDLIVEKSNAENNQDQAIQRHRDDPTLQDPQQLAGRTGAGGVGLWAYPDQPRTNTAGLEYQEQISNKPRGLEINIGGTPTTINGVPTAQGGKWFDDMRVDGSGRITLVDAKQWDGFVLPDQSWWVEQVFNTADGELRALRAAALDGRAQIEWPVSTQDAADAIRKVLDKELGDDASKISIVVVPKKGP